MCRKLSENQEQSRNFKSEPFKIAQRLFSLTKTLLEGWFLLAHKHKPGKQKYGDTEGLLQTRHN